jgi:hypothetical protein
MNIIEAPVLTSKGLAPIGYQRTLLPSYPRFAGLAPNRCFLACIS